MASLHSCIAARNALDLRRIDRAFFHANVGVSTSFFVFTLLDRVLAAAGLPTGEQDGRQWASHATNAVQR